MPVEKQLEEDQKRQKILRMRMQLKNSTLGGNISVHRRRQSDQSWQAMNGRNGKAAASGLGPEQLDAIFKSEISSIGNYHT